MADNTGADKKKVTLKQLLTEKDPKSVIDGMKFEQGMALLEELVGRVEGGELDLENSILSYERGTSVLEHLRGLLTQAESKLEVIREKSS